MEDIWKSIDEGLEIEVHICQRSEDVVIVHIEDLNGVVKIPLVCFKELASFVFDNCK